MKVWVSYAWYMGLVNLVVNIHSSSGQIPMTSNRVSTFGEYSGYSHSVYEGWVRTSQYLQMSDGVRLAADLIRPSRSGKVVNTPMPVVWAYYRYHRAREEAGRILSLVDRKPDLQLLLKHGYVIVVVDARGTGASFGYEDTGPNSPNQARDVYEVTEWIASQEWCDGNVAMFGHSYSANIQIVGAATAPPHLRAIFPVMAAFDTYEIMYPGGVFADELVRGISQALRRFDIEMETVPVDDDSTGEMLREARMEHTGNANPYDLISSFPFRDTTVNNLAFWLDRNLGTHRTEVNETGIPVYLWAGWKDFLIKESFLWYANLETPKKLTIGPWSHSSYDWFDLLGIEQLRWFDYWLKGIDNGIVEESPIHYAVMRDDIISGWKKASSWPIPGTRTIKWYCNPGSSDNSLLVNDGVLCREMPSEEEAFDTLRVHAAESSDTGNPLDNDAKGITYTTKPIEKDILLIGHPVVTLQIAAAEDDIDFFACLEDIDAEGKSQLLTDSVLRASHRSISEPPIEYLDLPYHRHFEEDIDLLAPNSIIELIFDCKPLSAVIVAGHRMRLSITCATIRSQTNTAIESGAKIQLHRSGQYPSFVELPLGEMTDGSIEGD